MTLYREITDEERRTWSASRYTTISAVPVEPCKHGNYVGHIKPTQDWAGAYGPTAADWCDGPGAGIGETP